MAIDAGEKLLDNIIKLSIGLIVVIIIGIPLYIFKPWEGKYSLPNPNVSVNMAPSATNNYTDLIDPVYTISGIFQSQSLGKIKLEVTTSEKTNIVEILTDGKTSYNLVPLVNQDGSVSKVKAIKLGDLKRGQRLVVITKEDLRTYSGQVLTATSISAMEANTTISGFVEEISGSAISMKGEDNLIYEIKTSPNTQYFKIIGGTPNRDAFEGITKGDGILIETEDRSPSQTKLANKITFTKADVIPLFGTIKQINDDSVIIDRHQLDANQPLVEFTVIIDDSTTYTTKYVSKNQSIVSTKADMQVSDTITVTTTDPIDGVSSAKASNILINKP